MSEARDAARALLLLRDALDLESADRAAFLDRACAGEAALRAEIESLLTRAESGGEMLGGPALALAGQLLEDEPASREGDTIGVFQLGTVLGEGGMGTVYRAQRSGADFTQKVALKIIRAGVATTALRERFRRERAILAGLDHPGIARFVDGGITAQGELWFAMALIEGESITRYAARHALDLPARVALLADVCDAVAAAHRSLVVHRDIKPSNIMVDGEGRPHLLDFGIARLLDGSDGDATLTDARAMTPHYAAPEQIRGEAVTTATDVYALGVVLFELLTGHRPFGEGTVTPFNVQRAVLEASRLSLVAAASGAAPVAANRDAAPQHAPTWSRRLRGDLEHIVERALAREPARRYASVEALAEDLRLHLSGRPIRARPDSLGYRTRRFVQRNRLMVVLASLAVIALFATTGVSVLQAQRAEHESQRANLAAREARSESARATAAAELARLERDAARDESQRQDTLREHFVAVLNRATESGDALTPESLTELVADPKLLGVYRDPDLRRALDLAIVEFFVTSGDFPRVLALLDELKPRLKDAPGRYRAMAASNEALAAIRVGELDVAEAAVETAEKAMSAEQRRGGGLESRIEMLRGQLQRARGDAAASEQSALRSAQQARDATDISEFERGSTLGSAAVALLQLGDLGAAAELAAEAGKVWEDAGVAANASMRSVATVRTNAQFLRGELLASVAGMQAINTDAGTTEPPASRAARDITQAKALALLARRGEAVAVVDAAVSIMCKAVGPTSLDCLRVRLSSVDTLTIAGEIARAQGELDAIAPQLAAQPPLLAAGTGFRGVLTFLAAPDETGLSTVVNAAKESANKGAMPQRNAVRMLLVLAETIDARGNQVYADNLARAAIDIAGDAIDGTGMDPSLLALWRARLAGAPPDAAVLANLSSAIGAEHPWVIAHRTL